MTMGRGSAMLAVAIFLVSAAMGVRGATYSLPGSWMVPTMNADIYNVWAQNVSSYLVEGDVIIFQYLAAAHNVVTLGTQAEYDGCDSTTPLNTTETGNDAIIVKAGINFYICGRNGHCQAGQKVSVTASAANIIPPTISPVASTPVLSPPLSAPTISPALGAALPAINTITPAAAPQSAASVTVPQVVAAAIVAAVACIALF